MAGLAMVAINVGRSAGSTGGLMATVQEARQLAHEARVELAAIFISEVDGKSCSSDARALGYIEYRHGPGPGSCAMAWAVPAQWKRLVQ